MPESYADLILTVCFSTVILICMIFITWNIYNYGMAEKEYSDLSPDSISFEVGTSPSGNEAVTSEEAIVPVSESYFDRLYRINPDLVCILSIPSIDLMYPVVQGKDNKKYLSYTFEGRLNPAGCLFLDYQNNISDEDAPIFIYGHNMKDGSMFGNLKRVTKEDFDISSVKAYLITREKTQGYKMDKAEVVDINEYAPCEEDKGKLILYTCWGNDSSRRLLVKFSKDEDG